MEHQLCYCRLKGSVCLSASETNKTGTEDFSKERFILGIGAKPGDTGKLLPSKTWLPDGL